MGKMGFWVTLSDFFWNINFWVIFQNFEKKSLTYLFGTKEQFNILWTRFWVTFFKKSLTDIFRCIALFFARKFYVFKHFVENILSGFPEFREKSHSPRGVRKFSKWVTFEWLFFDRGGGGQDFGKTWVTSFRDVPLVTSKDWWFFFSDWKESHT